MNAKKYDFVIIGAGLSGCTLANLLATKGKRVLILEKRNHVGGNIFDVLDKETGVIVQKYGPHIFHTNNEQVYNFIKNLDEWENFKLKCGVNIDGVVTSSPFNLRTIDQFFPNSAELIKKELKKEYPEKQVVTIIDLLESSNPVIKEYADFLYAEDYSLYTAKQWGIKPEDVDKSVLRRVPVRLDTEECYFTDKYQLMPKNGFSRVIESLLNNEFIDVKVNIDAKKLLNFSDDKVVMNIEQCDNAQIIYTGSLDALFDYCFGLLPYRSLEFVYKTISQNNYQEYPVVAYPKDPGFTRITDYNQLPPQHNLTTVIAYEYPKQYTLNSKTDPYYPINNPINNELHGRYVKLASKYKNLYLCGRLADYKYYNMDQALQRAFEIADVILENFK